MSGVNESIVREFFEARGFLVRQQRKFIAPGLQSDDEIDFVVVNLHRSEVRADLPQVLDANAMDGLATAVVAVKGWHTETFSAALLAQEPEVARFTDPEAIARCTQKLGLKISPSRILVVPSLPQTQAERQKAVDALRQRGVDAVLPFRAVLASLIEYIEINRNYAKSDLLQILRILKNYDLLKEPGLDLFQRRRRGRR